MRTSAVFTGCVPSEECCRGTNPTQAAKSRPRLKLVMSGAKASTPAPSEDLSRATSAAASQCPSPIGGLKRDLVAFAVRFPKPRQAPGLLRRDGRRGFAGCGRRVRFGGLPPSLCRELRDAIEDDAQDALVGARCRQVQTDLRFHLDHPRSDFDEAQSQRVELGDGKARAPRHRGPQAPHQPVSTGMQESRNWLAVALVQDVRSAARCVFQDLMWFSAAPRRQ